QIILTETAKGRELQARKPVHRKRYWRQIPSALPGGSLNSYWPRCCERNGKLSSQDNGYCRELRTRVETEGQWPPGFLPRSDLHGEKDLQGPAIHNRFAKDGKTQLDQCHGSIPEPPRQVIGDGERIMRQIRNICKHRARTLRRGQPCYPIAHVLKGSPMSPDSAHESFARAGLLPGV